MIPDESLGNLHVHVWLEFLRVFATLTVGAFNFRMGDESDLTFLVQLVNGQLPWNNIHP